MNWYTVGGVAVATPSVLPLPEIAGKAEPELHFRVGRGEAPLAQGCAEGESGSRIGRDNNLLLARSNEGYILSFLNVATFLLANNLHHIVCYPEPDTPAATIQHLFLDQVMPRILSHKGEVVLHAGGVVVDGAAVAFVGESRSGKSTLCAAFSQAGFPLLGDDFLLIRPGAQRFLAVPSYPGLRLWPDTRRALAWDAGAVTPMAHYTTKERLAPLATGFRFCDQPVPLAAIFILDTPQEPPPQTVRIAPVAGRAAMMAFVRCSFLLDPADAARNRQMFADLGAIATRLPLFRLSYPRELSALPAVRQAVLDHLAVAAAA